MTDIRSVWDHAINDLITWIMPISMSIIMNATCVDWIWSVVLKGERYGIIHALWKCVHDVRPSFEKVKWYWLWCNCGVVESLFSLKHLDMIIAWLQWYDCVD